MQLTGRPPVLGEVVAHGRFGSGAGRLTPAAVWYSLHMCNGLRGDAPAVLQMCVVMGGCGSERWPFAVSQVAWLGTSLEPRDRVGWCFCGRPWVCMGQLECIECTARTYISTRTQSYKHLGIRGPLCGVLQGNYEWCRCWAVACSAGIDIPGFGRGLMRC